MATLETLDLGLLPPGRMTAPRIIGGAVEGGASLSGVSVASDITGGGLIAVDYNSIFVSNTNQARMRYFNRIAVMLSGGVRRINVPLMTDFWAPIRVLGAGSFDSGFDNSFLAAPVPGSNPGVQTVPFSDASTFSDTSLFSQEAVSGAVRGDFLAGIATITISVVGGTEDLTGGEWFGLNHVTRGRRAYCITDVDAKTTVGGISFFTVGIRPTLRDAIADGARVSWWRPLCQMRLAPGFSPDMDVEQFWMTTPSLRFVEAF